MYVVVFHLKMQAVISNDEFTLFHRIDRDLYTKLVFNLDRDPEESMLVMAFFLWLERLGCYNLVFDIVPLPLPMVNMFADEALACLGCIYGGDKAAAASSSSGNNDISLLRAFSRRAISLQFFHAERATAIESINKILREVCGRALWDIMERARATQRSNNNKLVLGTASSSASSSEKDSQVQVLVHPDNRTMFITFSKGYPVSEAEVKEFFNRSFGECVESIQMQEVAPNEQSLFARVVLCSPQKVDMILNGSEKVKFAINGKHVWSRKFVPKRPVLPPAATATAAALMPQQLANMLGSLSLQ
ncbi:hypothetical protein Dimus_025868 [Dionaea muscipula]